MTFDEVVLPHETGFDEVVLPSHANIVPTPGELSTLAAPEGSPQRDDINRSVAGNIFAPPGAFARQPTLSELINASMPRGVQESQRDEGRIPLAPPLPEQGAFEQGGVEGAIMPGVEAASSVASNLTPRTDSWAHLATDLGSFATPAVGGVQELVDAPDNARKDFANARAQMNGASLHELPFPERLDPVTQAQLMPEGPEKQQALLNAGANVVAQMLLAKGIAHGIAQPEPSHIRTEPLVQEPPPTESLGPGTTRADVSRALERRFELQPTPPPDIAPAPTIEETLAQSIRKAPQMPVDPDVTQSLAQRILAQRTLTPEVLRAFREQAEPLPPPEVAREPLGLESETAVEKAMRTTSPSPLQSAIDIVRGQEQPSVNLPEIPGVTRPPIPVEQPVLPDQQRIVPSETARFTPPSPEPGTPLKGTPLVDANGNTPAAKVAAQAAVPPEVQARVANLPEYMQQNVLNNAARLEKSGVADQIEELAAQRLTAKQISDKLGIPIEDVMAIRITRGIPSMNAGGAAVAGYGGGPQVSPEFEAWVKSRQAPEAPVQTPVSPSGGVPVSETPQTPLIPAEDARFTREGSVPTEGAQLPSANLPESGFDTERAQALYGKDAVLITEGHSAKAWKAIGKADPRNPYDVLEQSRARGIATPKDAAKLRDEHRILQERARQAYGTPEYNDLAQNAVDFLNASKEVAHGPAAEIFRVLQEADEPTYMSPADYDNILRERQMQATPDETATFKKVADEVRSKDTAARTEAANGQEAIRKYKPNEVVPFDEASNYVKEKIKELTEPCPL